MTVLLLVLDAGSSQAPVPAVALAGTNPGMRTSIPAPNPRARATEMGEAEEFFFGTWCRQLSNLPLRSALHDRHIRSLHSW